MNVGKLLLVEPFFSGEGEEGGGGGWVNNKIHGARHSRTKILDDGGKCVTPWPKNGYMLVKRHKTTTKTVHEPAHKTSPQQNTPVVPIKPQKKTLHASTKAQEHPIKKQVSHD